MESINEMKSSELKECCAEVDEQIGASVQKIFVNMITKAEERMQSSYENICQSQKLEEIIRASLASSESSATDKNVYGSNAESSLNAMVVAEKQKEKERLTTAIQQLDGDVRRTKEMLARLRAQIQNEVAAATEECQKMSIAAAQIGQNQVQ